MGLFDDIRNNKKNDDPVEKQQNFIRDSSLIEGGISTSELDAVQQESRTDLLKWQQNLEDEMLKLRFRLKSFHLNPNTGQWEPKMILVGYDKDGNKVFDELPPLANDMFIDYVQSQVEPFLSRNLFSTNLDMKRILDILRYTCDDIADAMADGWDIYDIEFMHYDLVIRLIKNVIIPGPFRALNDGQRRHDRTVAKRVEAFSDRQKISSNKSIMGVRK